MERISLYFYFLCTSGRRLLGPGSRGLEDILSKKVILAPSNNTFSMYFQNFLKGLSRLFGGGAVPRKIVLCFYEL